MAFFLSVCGGFGAARGRSNSSSGADGAGRAGANRISSV